MHISQRYTDGAHLCPTSHGEVRLCHDTQGRGVVVKRFDHSFADARQEMKVLRAVMSAQGKHTGSHHIVQLLDYVENEDNACLVLEHIAGEELFALVEKTDGAGLGEGIARKLFRQIALGLACVHRSNYAHLDVSPENCLVENAVAKICDFGLARPAGDVMTGACGKLGYMAPEIAKPSLQAGETPYDLRKADIYSLGITLAVMLLGFQPYTIASQSQDQKYDVLVKHGFRTLMKCYRMEDHFSEPMMDLLEHMLCPHASRFNIENVLQHPALLA